MTAVQFLEKICKDRGYHLMEDYFEKAKEMEKQMVIDIVEKSRTTGLTAEYLLLTYGSKGSDEYTTVNWGGVIQKIPKKGNGELEQINQDNPVTRGSTALVRVTSSQTEISDEEIEKYAKSNNPYPLTKQGSVDWEHGFITAIEWYREQIKSK